MKTRSLLFLLMGSYFFMTCDDGFVEDAMPMEMEEEEVVAYPLKYVYTGVDFQPTDFYTYQVDNFEQITITQGIYTTVDSILFATLYDTESGDEFVEEWPFQIIELLDDTLLRMEIKIAHNPAIDTTFTYRKETNQLIINYFGTEGIFEILEDSNTVRWCSQTYGFNYFNERNERRETSPFDSGDCESGDVYNLLENIVGRFNNIEFQKNDTFYVNYSYFNLERIE